MLLVCLIFCDWFCVFPNVDIKALNGLFLRCRTVMQLLTHSLTHSLCAELLAVALAKYRNDSNTDCTDFSTVSSFAYMKHSSYSAMVWFAKRMSLSFSYCEYRLLWRDSVDSENRPWCRTPFSRRWPDCRLVAAAVQSYLERRRLRLRRRREQPNVRADGKLDTTWRSTGDRRGKPRTVQTDVTGTGIACGRVCWRHVRVAM